MIDRLVIPYQYACQSRLSEYTAILGKAIELGYSVCGVHAAWKLFQQNHEKVLILRHDVDHLSPGLQGMLTVEHQFNVSSTYYFRWSTAQVTDLEKVCQQGHEAALHYETLATFAANHHLREAADITPDILEQCADLLIDEIAQFRRMSGAECKTIASHGAPRNRLLGITNDVLLSHCPELYARLDIDLEAYDPVFLSEIDCYIADTQWEINHGFRYGTHPLAALGQYPRICLLTHPNHWDWSPQVRAKRIAKGILRGRQKDNSVFAYAERLRA